MQEDNFDLLDGIVEVDETFVGGKVSKEFPPRGKKDKFAKGTQHLQPVFGMVQRAGKVIAKVIDKPSRGIIMPILENHVTPSSTLVTDGSSAYFPAKEYFKKHMIMSRGSKIFKKGIYHKNTIEGFWSLFKRAIIGQYHRIETNNLQLYVDELCFKYNHRMSVDKGYSYLLNRLIKN